jgi:hypothetical protein
VEIWLEVRDWAACGKQSPVNNPQNHVQPATPPKSANTFNFFNFKKWRVTASGAGFGGVSVGPEK